MVYEGGRWIDLRAVNGRLRMSLVVACVFVPLSLGAWAAGELGPDRLGGTLATAAVAVWLLMSVTTALLAQASHGSVPIGVYTCCFAVIPLVGLFMTAVVILHAVQTLPSRGVRVGWFGADDADLGRAGHRVCGCGYALEGIPGAVRPECGAGPDGAPGRGTPTG